MHTLPPGSPARADAGALLRPTLTDEAPCRPLLSPRATFFTAFFFGPLAATLVGADNLRRVGRLRQEGWLVALGLLLSVAALAASALVVLEPAGLQEWLGARPRTASRRLVQGLGLAVWGLFHLRLRPQLRAAQLSGEGFASPWRTALGCGGVAALVHLLVLALARLAHAGLP